MNTDIVMAEPNHAIASRNHPKVVIHYSDRGAWYLSIRYTNKIADSGLIVCVDTTGDLLEHSFPPALGQSNALLFPSSNDNALAETVDGLYKTEVIDNLKQQWHGVSDVELVTLNGLSLEHSSRLAKLNRYLIDF